MRWIRRRPDARRARDVWTDAHRAEVPERAPSPEVRPPQPPARRRGLIAVLLGIVFLATSTGALIGKGGYLDVRNARKELRATEDRFWDGVKRIHGLNSEVEELRQDPGAVERIAREELGYVRDGETTFLLPRPEDGPPP